MRRVPRPDKSTPFFEPGGQIVSQAWFDFFGYLEARGVLDVFDVDNSTPIADTQVLVYDAASGKFKPGAN